MKRAALVLATASMLSACARSNQLAAPFFLPPPLPRPQMANPDPCRPTPLRSRADGSLDSAGAERAIRAGDADLARCRADRDRYRDAWPDGRAPTVSLHDSSRAIMRRT